MRHIIRYIFHIMFFACLTMASTFAQDDAYYWADGREIKLTATKDFRAIQYSRTDDAAITSRLKSLAESNAMGAARIVEARISRIREKYQTVLLLPPDGVDPTAFDQGVKDFSDNLTNHVQFPVYRVGNVKLILTNRFGIEFEKDQIGSIGISSGQSNADVAEFLAEVLGQRVEFRSDDLDADPNAFLDDVFDETAIARWNPRQTGRVDISFPKTTPVTKALEKINGAKDDPRVRVAYPNFIRIQPPLRQTPVELVTLAATAASATCPDPTDPEIPNDAKFADQWSLKNANTNPNACEPDPDIDAEEAWAITEVARASSDVKIAILDLGVDLNHDDLKEVIDGGIDATTTANGTLGGPECDEDDHGTAVAGLAAAETDNCIGIAGVAWNAKILPVRIGENCPVTKSNIYGWILDKDDVKFAFEQAILDGAKVLVNSWNDNPVDPNLDENANDTAPPPDNSLGNQANEQVISDAIRTAAEQAVVIFSAGNHYKSSHCSNYPPGAGVVKTCWSEVTYPATLAAWPVANLRADNMIVVSATNKLDSFKTVKNYRWHPPGNDPDSPLWNGTPQWNGFDTSWGSNHGLAVSLSAPGARQWTTVRGSMYNQAFDGTSAAAPLVGGAAAVLLAVHPTATPAQIKKWLQDGADPGLYQQESNCDPVRDDFYGHGRLNLLGALEAAADEMQIADIPPGDTEITLEVEARHIPRNDDKWAWATVRVDGATMEGRSVDFRLAGWFGWTPAEIVTDPIEPTNSSGVAKAKIKATSFLPWIVKIHAETEGDSTSKRVTVPALSGWAIVLLMLIGCGALTRQERDDNDP